MNINNTGCFQLRYILIYRAQGFLQTAIHALCADQYSEIFISFYQHVAELHLLTQLHWSQSTLNPPFSVIRYEFLASLQEVRLDVKFTLLIFSCSVVYEFNWFVLFFFWYEITVHILYKSRVLHF